MVMKVKRANEALSCFTLEFSPDRPNKTAVGKWQAEGMRLNLGSGPQPSIEDWIDYITEQFSREEAEVGIKGLDFQPDVGGEASLFERLTADATSKSERTRLLDSEIVVDPELELILMTNAEALLVFFSALKAAELS